MIDSVGIYLVSQQISNMWTKENKQHEDHDGPISLTWANRFTYLKMKFHTIRLLKIFV